MVCSSSFNWCSFQQLILLARSCTTPYVIIIIIQQFALIYHGEKIQNKFIILIIHNSTHFTCSYSCSRFKLYSPFWHVAKCSLDTSSGRKGKRGRRKWRLDQQSRGRSRALFHYLATLCYSSRRINASK